MNTVRLVFGWLFLAGLTAAGTYYAFDEADHRIGLARFDLHGKLGIIRYTPTQPINNNPVPACPTPPCNNQTPPPVCANPPCNNQSPPYNNTNPPCANPPCTNNQSPPSNNPICNNPPCNNQTTTPPNNQTPPYSFNTPNPICANPPCNNQTPLPYNNQQPPYNNQNPPYNNHAPPYNNQRPPYNNTPPYNNQVPPYNNQRPYNNQPPYNNQIPPYNNQRQPNNNQTPPYNNQAPPNRLPAVDTATNQRFIDLKARVEVMGRFYDQMDRNNRAQGIGPLRTDLAVSLGLMRMHMQLAAQAMQSGNASTANFQMNDVEKQYEVLRKFKEE
ncbi:MAG TPA: hypothetical protein VMH81_19235 [Bryobacteraceae bacterium]|nr:hypothetical protein [Bryobacteraceae bacterium]